MNKSIIALAVASTLGVWGGANATDITENQTTDKTGVSANETYNLADGVTWTVGDKTNQWGLFNNNTVLGENASLSLNASGNGDINAAIGEGGATIDVDTLKITSQEYAIYQSFSSANPISIKANTINIKAGAESAIYNSSGNDIRITDFDTLTVESSSEAAIKITKGTASISGNTVNLTSDGASALNTHGSSSVSIKANTINISSTVNDDTLGAYKKSAVNALGNSTIILDAENVTINASGDAVQNAIASDSTGAIQIDADNATINGNITSNGEFELNGKLLFNGDTASFDTINGDANLHLNSSEQKVSINSNDNELLTVSGSGDMNDGANGSLATAFANLKVGEGTVDLALEEGMYNGATTGVLSDGAVTNVTTKTNTLMRDTLDLASGTTVMLNRILMNDVHKRLGDLRNSAGMNGAWVRYDGGRLSGDGVANKFNTIQLGADMPFAENFHAGVSASYTRGDADFARGGAGMDVYSLAAYGTWFAPNGMYADVIARYGRVKNELTVDHNLKGNLNNNAVALSGEFGWQFDVAKDFFVTPQVEASYMHIDSDSVKLGDKASYKFDSTDSFIGRAGVAAGYTFPNQKGNVFVKASAVHEFAGDAKVTGANGTSLKKDGKDTWAEFGVGAQYNFNKNVQAWANLERTAGADIEEDYRATVGVRINF